MNIDPVVLSSGKIVDRRSVFDKEGNLLYSRCPFSGKQLKSEAFPVEDLKKQIDIFRMKRESKIIQIAQIIVSRGNFHSFHEILDISEMYLKGLGESYLTLTRELAAIWSGIRIKPPIMLLIDNLMIKGINRWITAVETDYLDDEVHSIFVSIEKFQDGGRGPHKSHLALGLYDENGEIVERCRLFDDHLNDDHEKHISFNSADYIVANAKAGYYYKLEYMIGSSHEHVEVQGLCCKIIPTSTAESSYRMHDRDGYYGLYIGSTNAQKDAHGEGSLDYDDGKRFVGLFQNGSMVNGVLFRGSQVICTMEGGKWSKIPDIDLIEKFPSNMIVFTQGNYSKNHELRKRINLQDGDNYSRSEFQFTRPSGKKEYYDKYVNDSYQRYLHATTSRASLDNESTSKYSRYNKRSAFNDIVPRRMYDHFRDDEYFNSPYHDVFPDNRVSRFKKYSLDQTHINGRFSRSHDDDSYFRSLRNRSRFSQDDLSLESKSYFHELNGPRNMKIGRHLTSGKHDYHSDDHEFSSRRNKAIRDPFYHNDTSSIYQSSVRSRRDPNLTKFRNTSGKKSNSLGIDPEDNDIHSSFRTYLSNFGGVINNVLGSLHGEDVDEVSYRSSGKKDNFLGSVNGEDVDSSHASIPEHKNRSICEDSDAILKSHLRPFIIRVPRVVRKLKEGGAWLGIAQSGFLEDFVDTLMLSVEFFLDDNLKSNIGIALYNESGKFVTRCNIFGNRKKSTATKGYFRLIGNDEKIVSMAKPGYFYQLQCAVNSGRTDILQLRGFTCKIFSSTYAIPKYQIKDNDGDKGYYFGPVNSKSEADGKGILEYENGSSFVGLFARGVLIKGVYYKGREVRATMTNRKWNQEIDRDIVKEYPICFQKFSREVSKEDIDYTEDNDNDDIIDEDSQDGMNDILNKIIICF